MGLLAAAVIYANASPWAFAFAGLLGGAGAGIFGLAMQATVRNLVPKHRLSSANSTLEIIDSLFTLLIPVFAGMLVGIVGPGWVIGVTSIAFAIAALLRMGLQLDAAEKECSPSPDKCSRSQLIVYRFLETLTAPFRGEGRRFITVGFLCLSTTGLVLIPLASLQVTKLGGSAISIGFAMSAAGASGFVTSFLAGRFRTLTQSIRLTLVILIFMLVSVPALLLSPNFAIVIILVGLTDGMASWLYVSLPTLRMATESSRSLISIAAGLMSFNALLTFVVGTGLSIFGKGNELGYFVLTASAVSIALVIFFGRPKILRAVQTVVDT